MGRGSGDSTNRRQFCSKNKASLQFSNKLACSLLQGASLWTINLKRLQWEYDYYFMYLKINCQSLILFRDFSFRMPDLYFDHLIVLKCM